MILKRYRPCKAVDLDGNVCGIQSVDGFDFCDQCLGEALHRALEQDEAPAS